MLFSSTSVCFYAHIEVLEKCYTESAQPVMAIHISEEVKSWTYLMYYDLNFIFKTQSFWRTGPENEGETTIRN